MNYNLQFSEKWEKSDLYSLAEWVNGLAFRDFNFKDKGHTPVIKINEIKYGITSQTKFTDDTFDSIYSLSPGDMLFSWSGSPDTSIDIFWFGLKKGWLNQHIFKVLPKDGLKKEFFYFLLKYLKPLFIEIARNKQTTGLGHVTRSDLREIMVSYPNWEIQTKISDILLSIEKKIELNNRINQTLEQIAQAIFKHWFIDFEFPNEEGKPYKSSGGKMRESELGEIPDNWMPGVIIDEFNIVMGQSPDGTTYNEREEGIPFYQGRTDFGFRYPSNRVFCTAPKRFANENDTLVSVRAPVGSLNMAFERCCIGRGVAAVRHKSQSISYTYYYFLTHKDIFNRFEAEGTVFGAMGREQFEGVECIIPNKRIIEEFENVISSIDKQIRNNECQIQMLTKIRDSLLPKLMSGTLKVMI